MILCFIKNNHFMYSNSNWCFGFVCFFFQNCNHQVHFGERKGGMSWQKIFLYLHPQGKK